MTRRGREQRRFPRLEAHNQGDSALGAGPFRAVPVGGVRAAARLVVKLLEQLLPSASGTVPRHLAHVPVPSFGATSWGLKTILTRAYDKARDLARRVRRPARPARPI